MLNRHIERKHKIIFTNFVQLHTSNILLVRKSPGGPYLASALTRPINTGTTHLQVDRLNNWISNGY